jgi:hypothetical protein
VNWPFNVATGELRLQRDESALSCLGFLGSRSRFRVGVEGIADPNWTERAFDVKQALIAPTAPAKAVACIL